MRMRARFGAESGRENYRNPLESQATVTDVKNTTWNMESQTDNEFCKENNVRRCRRWNSDPADSSSLRSPLTKHHREWEETSSGQGRRQRQGSYRSRRPDQKATLAQFAPELMAMLQTSPFPQTKNNASVGHADKAGSRSRKWSSDLDDSFSMRSPLNKKQKEWTGASPVRGRGQPGHHRGQYRSRRSVHPRPPTASEEAAKLPASRQHPVTKETADADSVDPGSDSRVRKRLWADEVDEAFVDGDHSEDEAILGNDQSEETPIKPLTEQQLARRQKDIDYGKSTVGYHNYCQQVPKEKRGKQCPHTPQKEANHSRRKWDYLVHKWRRDLHRWDVPGKTVDDAPRASTPTKLELHQESSEGTTTPVSHKLPWSPSSSPPSTPSDPGYVTPSSSRANHSQQQLDDEDEAFPQVADADFPQGDADFPPLTDWANTHQQACLDGVWGAAHVAEDGQEEAGEDNWEKSVGKLMITDEEGGRNGDSYMPEEPLQ